MLRDRIRGWGATGAAIGLLSLAQGQFPGGAVPSGLFAASRTGGTLVFTDSLNGDSLSAATFSFPNGLASGIKILLPATDVVNPVGGSAYRRAPFGTGFSTFASYSPGTTFEFGSSPMTHWVSVDTKVVAGGSASRFTMPTADTSDCRGFRTDQVLSVFNPGDHGRSNEHAGIEPAAEQGSDAPELVAHAAFFGAVSLAFCSVAALALARHQRCRGVPLDR